jgi:hypothetical protein
MNRIAFILAVGLLFSSGILRASETRTPEDRDKILLENLKPPENGMDYVRCEDTVCYILRTGEVVGTAPDGIYLVWVVSE